MDAADALMKICSRISRRQIVGNVNSFDHKLNEYRVLRWLRTSEAKGMKVSELSKALQVTSPFITQLLNHMERKELIIRKRDSKDGRIVRSYLTDEGKRLIVDAEQKFRHRFIGLVEHLGEEDSRKLADLLGKTLDYMEGQIHCREKESE